MVAAIMTEAGTTPILLSVGYQKGILMTDSPRVAAGLFGDINPKLADLTDDVLFGDVWARTELSPRDRSLITVSALVALYRTNELPSHLRRALANGVTADELVELFTHLAFYSGWPTAVTATTIARAIFAEANATKDGQS